MNHTEKIKELIAAGYSIYKVDGLHIYAKDNWQMPHVFVFGYTGYSVHIVELNMWHCFVAS